MVSTSDGGLEGQNWECLGPVGSSPISLTSYISLCLVLFLNFTRFTHTTVASIISQFHSLHTDHCCQYYFSISLTSYIPLLPVLFLNFTHLTHTIVANIVCKCSANTAGIAVICSFLAGCNGTENNHYFQRTLLWLN